MSAPPVHPRDPLGWHVVLAIAFLVLVGLRLTIPSILYFDEVHYVPAARTILELSAPRNVEHPPLGKEMLALGMALFGDRPLGWRIMPAVFGTLTLFAVMRAVWFAGCSRGASVLTGLFLLTGFPLFVQSRIAMLDIFMVAFVMLALWMCAGALREPETGRGRLALAGMAMGAAMASKWNAVPLAVLPGLTFLVLRIRAEGWRFATTRRGAPVPGMRLAEAFVWLGLVPLAVYAATYWPFAFYARPGTFFEGANYLDSLIGLHEKMLALQTQVLKPHPYQSTWPQWVINWRAIWYLYEPVDGAQRGVLMVGNPLTMLAGLPALGWCVWAGVKRGRTDAGAVALLYAVSLGMWIVTPKSVQFYYHYFLSSCFLLAALALATDALWRRGQRVLPGALVLGSVALFNFYYPILNAAPLAQESAFLRWTWLDSWR